MAARGAVVLRRTSQRRQLHAVGPLGLLQRLLQRLGAHRLDQVADRADLEGLEGEFVVGGAEDHRRRGFALAQPRRHLQSVQAGHANVQQHDVRPEAVDQAQRLFAVAGQRLEHAIAIQLPDHPGQALARQGFIVDDQDIHDVLASCVGLAQA
ncbi:hypothetical protein D3C86_1660420 [compost metagenome]